LQIAPSKVLQRFQNLAPLSAAQTELLDGHSAIGGGAGPNMHPETTLIAISHQQRTASEIETALRAGTPPIIARIANDRVLIDLRTVDPAEESDLHTRLTQLSLKT